MDWIPAEELGKGVLDLMATCFPGGWEEKQLISQSFWKICVFLFGHEKKKLI